jgi:hypothetical protein
MEFEPPNQISNMAHSVKITTEETMTTIYLSSELESHTAPPEDSIELRMFIAKIANMYEIYSSRWFPRTVISVNFIEKATNNWDFGKFPSYTGNAPSVTVRQTWCPEQLLILPTTFQIQWKMVNVNYIEPKISGQHPPEDDIPYLMEVPPLQIQHTLRTRARNKLRKARLQAAIYRWKMNELQRKYYEKYGNLEGVDGESILSSDIESGEEN